MAQYRENSFSQDSLHLTRTRKLYVWSRPISSRNSDAKRLPEESGLVVKKVPRESRIYRTDSAGWSTCRDVEHRAGEVDKRETSDTSPRPIFLPGRSTQPRLDDLEGPRATNLFEIPNVQNVSHSTTARGSRNLQYNLDEYEFCSYEYMGKYEALNKKLSVNKLKIFRNLKLFWENIYSKYLSLYIVLFQFLSNIEQFLFKIIFIKILKLM